MRRAQAAMEFLMTYGWAILVVLAAIGALAYFGVLSPSRFLPDQCQMESGFACFDYKIDASNDQVRFRLRNTMGSDITNVNISLITNDCTLSSSLVQVGSWDNRGEQAMVFNCTGTGVPSTFDGDIHINWSRSGENEVHTSRGTIQGDAE